MSKLLNYGLVYKKSRGYRKALRQCKKNKRLYGASFDNSETWYLQIVFYQYCKDRNLSKHKFLKYFANYWHEDKVKKDYMREKGIDSFELENWPIIEERLVSLSNEINQDILQNINNKQREDLCNFLAPRLKAFKDLSMAYPLDLTSEQWDQYIQDTINEVEQNNNITPFINRIHDFTW